MDKKLLKLYAVTDRAWLNGNSLEQVVEEVLAGGATILQLREKHLSDEEFLAEGKIIRDVCERYRIPLIINDNIAVAKALGVGAHVGQSDMSIQTAREALGKDAIIGVSCQTVAQAVAAEKAGADYLGVGAVFPTETKKDADYVDDRQLAAIGAAVEIPVVAIGGINAMNLPQLGGSGIAGVAVVSALFAAADPRRATSDMSRQLDDVLAVPVPPRHGAIIDMDGTILNTLPFWKKLPVNYLRSKGREPAPTIITDLAPLELADAASYLKNRYKLDEDAQTIYCELTEAIRRLYTHDAPLLDGAETLLRSLHDKGVRLALFSATETPLAEAALKRTGIYDLFDCIIHSQETGYDKSHPEAFQYVLGKLGTDRKLTVVYEDADYAIAGAKLAGLQTVTPSYIKEFYK